VSHTGRPMLSTMTRRALSSICLIAAAACYPAGLLLAQPASRSVSTAVAPVAPPSSSPVAPSAPPSVAFDAFLEQVRAEAIGKGIVPAVVDPALAGVFPDLEVIELLNRQPEHDRTAGQYVSLLVSADRVAKGQAAVAGNVATLAAVEARFGVDRHVVAAIWGVETSYGASHGDRSVIRSLSTLAYGDPRRSQFWRGELIAALRILQNGDIPLGAMTGSWAGAMGHTQFMPSTYLRHAADLDSDGKRDIWRSTGDALASTANYLKASGWLARQPWGFQVTLPAGFDFAHSGPGFAKRAADWQSLGVATAPGTVWPATTGELSLLLPSGAAGPAFLTTPNFRAILRYNASSAYALSVGLLADALATGHPPQLTWPVDDRALTRAEREELQRLLTGSGHDTGIPDGIIGNQTRIAIRNWQKSQDLPQDGHPSEALLVRLRGAGK